MTDANTTGHQWLDRLEQTGNRLPDPVTLFLAGTAMVMLLSQLAVVLDWSVEKTLSGTGHGGNEMIGAVSLLDSDGLWWVLSHLVDNFVTFPPLGLVLVGLLGIGLAERSGLLPVVLRRLLQATPAVLLDPITVFLGILSSFALDAGYVVLPPLAAVLYAAAGRSPLCGIAAATAGVTAGFSANLLMGSASAKYALLAPVFVPMFMQAGISPELTQAAYRVGDSVTNGITPFNPYLVIILVFVRRYVPEAGIGTMLSLMLPYAIAFALLWGLMLGLWVAAGWPLGPGGGLLYPPPG